MGIFNYRAKKVSGETVEGNIEAQTEKEAIEKLSQKGYLPIYLNEEKKGPLSIQAQSEVAVEDSLKYKARVNSRQITVFTRSLASLLRAGVPILNALNIVLEQSENTKFKEVLKNIYTDVKHGAAFSSTLSQYPNIFSHLYIAMVHAGENSGDLPEALLRITDYRIKQEEALSRLKMALVYPVIMAVVGIGTVIFMLTFVMPRLMGMFLNMGQELPLPTKILIAISNGLRHNWLWILVVLVFLAVLIMRHLKTKPGKYYFSMLQLHIPVLGNIIIKAEVGRFCRTLELLVKNGISILKSIDIAIPVLKNEVIKQKLKNSYKDLEQGSSFGKSLKESNIVPVFVSNLITVGEESGKLEDVLREIADAYEKDVDELIKIMGNMIEPIMILGMGLVVGFIVIAMLLPVFEINV